MALLESVPHPAMRPLIESVQSFPRRHTSLSGFARVYVTLCQSTRGLLSLYIPHSM